MLEMCSGTSNYPWVTIWDIGMTYSGHFGKKSKKSQKHDVLGGVKKLPTIHRSHTQLGIFWNGGRV